MQGEDGRGKGEQGRGKREKGKGIERDEGRGKGEKGRERGKRQEREQLICVGAAGSAIVLVVGLALLVAAKQWQTQ